MPNPLPTTVPLREVVRDNVRVAMARRDLNRKDLAEALEVDPAWVTRRLNGLAAMTVDDLAKLATALDTTPAALITAGADQ